MGTHIAAEEREPLSGLIDPVTFHNPETGFCVLRLSYSRPMSEDWAAQIARQGNQPIDHLPWRVAV